MGACQPTLFGLELESRGWSGWSPAGARRLPEACGPTPVVPAGAPPPAGDEGCPDVKRSPQGPGAGRWLNRGFPGKPRRLWLSRLLGFRSSWIMGDERYRHVQIICMPRKPCLEGGSGSRGPILAVIWSRVMPSYDAGPPPGPRFVRTRARASAYFISVVPAFQAPPTSSPTTR